MSYGEVYRGNSLWSSKAESSTVGHDLFEKYPKPPLCSHSPYWSIRVVLFKMHCAFDLPVCLGLFQLTS
jgi:hypothetical protein